MLLTSLVILPSLLNCNFRLNFLGDKCSDSARREYTCSNSVRTTIVWFSRVGCNSGKLCCPLTALRHAVCDKMKPTLKCLYFALLPNEPRHEKTCFMPYANNKGADQPAHLCSLISAFVVRCLDSIISISYIQRYMALASFWSWAGRFESYLVGNHEDRFSRDEAQIWFNKLHHDITCLCHMWTTKVQISLRISAVWSTPMLTPCCYSAYSCFTRYYKII